jgi:hypothetical protein
LCILEAIMAAVTLFVLGNLVRRWRDRLAVDPGDPTHWRAPTWRAVWLAQATLAAMLAFWKLGSSGQEKCWRSPLNSISWTFLEWFDATSGRTGSQSIPWRIAAALAIAIWSHLSGAVLVPFALAAFAGVAAGVAPAAPARGAALSSPARRSQGSPTGSLRPGLPASAAPRASSTI